MLGKAEKHLFLNFGVFETHQHLGKLNPPRIPDKLRKLLFHTLDDIDIRTCHLSLDEGSIVWKDQEFGQTGQLGSILITGEHFNPPGIQESLWEIPMADFLTFPKENWDYVG